MPKSRTDIIAELNDLCRTVRGLMTNRVVQTSGIAALPAGIQLGIREKVEQYTDFKPENDPYGERDFGNFYYEGHSIFWKIDYYDVNWEFLSENPADPCVTRRVLTIMLAEEY